MPPDAAIFFLGLFHAAGVERAFNFTQYKQEKVPYFPNVKVQWWRNGDYQLVGFFRQTDTQMRRGSFVPDGENWPVSPQRKELGRSYAPLAWNDPTGDWTITLTDLFSAETELLLKVQVQ